MRVCLGKLSIRIYYFVADLSGDWSATGKIITFKNKLSSPDCDCVRFRVGVKWAQYGIDLPGSLHTNKIPAFLGRYPLLGFVCRLNIVPLDRDNGTSNSSNTDVVEKVNLLVAASQHGGTSVAEGSP